MCTVAVTLPTSLLLVKVAASVPQPPLGDGAAEAAHGGLGVTVVGVVDARRWEERHWG